VSKKLQITQNRESVEDGNLLNAEGPNHVDRGLPSQQKTYLLLNCLTLLLALVLTASNGCFRRAAHGCM
jgi:hypothetical protein